PIRTQVDGAVGDWLGRGEHSCHLFPGFAVELPYLARLFPGSGAVDRGRGWRLLADVPLRARLQPDAAATDQVGGTGPAGGRAGAFRLFSTLHHAPFAQSAELA